MDPNMQRAGGAGSADRESVWALFGGANVFGRDVNEKELVLLTSTVFVVSMLIVIVYKLARGWDDEFGKVPQAVLPVHTRATTKWVRTRKQHYGQLGTINEDEVFVLNMKRM